MLFILNVSICMWCACYLLHFNHLTPNGHFSGRTALLTYRCCIFLIYSTDIRTEYFKHAAHSPFFTLQNVVYFIMLPFFCSCIIHILYTGVLKFKRKFWCQRVKTCYMISALLSSKCYIFHNLSLFL
jgi:hypothetical protein